jgi:hypothetical protein
MTIKLSVSVRGSVKVPSFAPAIARANRRVARLGERAARLNVAKHTKTGETARNLRNRTTPDGVEWFDRAPQASFLEYGTRPHVIRPRRAKALRWVGESGPIFATKVNHPGTRPEPWLEPAITDHAGIFEDVYSSEVMEEFGG